MARRAPSLYSSFLASDWMTPMTSRRLVLNAGLVAMAGSLTGLAGVASAFRIEEDSGSARVKLLLDACETRNAHERLIAELVADLEPKQGAEKAKATVQAMDCPLCGCRLGLAPPTEPANPRF